MKQLIIDRSLDSHLKPVKDSDGNVSVLELSKDKIRVEDCEVKDFEVTGSATISGYATETYADAGDEKGWHGSTTRVKILHGDFIPDDGGRPIQIEDATGGTRRLKTHSTNPMFASVPIPTGYTATAVYVYGSATSVMIVYEADINSATVTTKGTGNIGTELDITDVESDTTNYILIEVAQGSSEYVYGGYMAITAS